VLTATNAGGITTAEVTVEALPPSIEGFSVDAPQTSPGEPVTLAWEVLGADSIGIEPGGFSTTDGVGTLQVAPLETTVYTLTATNPTGTVTAEVTVGVLPPIVVRLEADPPQIVSGSTSTITWDVRGADTIAIEPGGFTTTDGVGSWMVSPNETTVYTLTASNGAGTSSKTVTVEVQPFAIVDFSASDTTVQPGDVVTLSWDVVGMADVVLEPIGPVAMSGSLDVEVFSNTTFTLRASYGDVVDTRTLVVVVTFPAQNGLVFSWSPVDVPGTPPSSVVLAPFDVYVLALGLESDIFAFEFRLEAPPCMIILGAIVLTNPGGSINVGTPPYNYVVGIGACVPNEVLVPLVRLSCFIVDDACAETALLTLGPSQPTSFYPPTPGYLDCSSNLIRFNVGPPFALTDGGGTGVPAVVLGLQAAGTAEGIELAWDLGNTAPSSMTILRSVDGETFSTIARLERALARGTWTDRSAHPDVAYTYVAVADLDGVQVGSEPVRAQRLVGSPAMLTRLMPNRPNPFNPVTELWFALEEPGAARLDVYDLSGRRVRSFTFDDLPSGEHSVTWDATDDRGHRVASGVYVVQLDSSSGRDSRRITLLK
jgi:hypothetical protein